ncbi:DUF2237 family protein [Thermaurantimonas aggregans]|uniref:DUF2237 family protein n=1 Tax=Thermaurantimonas aggregans TaxID=2173829 RepID=UPI001FE65AA7|nr:DUF2237 domain-containing protein [Thermaurantimonas aggregans]MCX8147844.1 DUF2237 domain-containing protein [Thermaurantimonas aggregans]
MNTIKTRKAMIDSSLNIFDLPLEECSKKPLTGFFRNGCCDTGPEDVGCHTVCAVMTEEFLLFTRRLGNDLITPRPEYNFPGLKPGDRWCLCALRWKEAYDAGCAPYIIPEATHKAALRYIDIDILIQFALKNNTLDTNG